MNVFQLNYDARLKAWHELRLKLEGQDTKSICISVDQFWQHCPLVNHYLHPDFIHEWPDPWELIAENNYCPYAKALGMIYTLILLGITDIDFVDAKDDNSEDVILVLVDNAKYILNYWPNTVVNNCLQDFKIAKRHSISSIITKIGKT